MYKVFFQTEAMMLNLNKISCQIVAKKDNLSVPLTKECLIEGGVVRFGEQTEFMICQNDPQFTVQVNLLIKDFKKLGGQITIDLSDWDGGVQHISAAGLSNSPDPNGQLHYRFLYYVSEKVVDVPKTLMLCSEFKSTKLFNDINDRNQDLIRKNRSLENQIKTLKEKNEALQNGHEAQRLEYESSQREHNEALREQTEAINAYKKSLEISNLQLISERKFNEKLKRNIERNDQRESEFKSLEGVRPSHFWCNDPNHLSRKTESKCISEDLVDPEGVGEKRERSREKNTHLD